ncbi:TetR/AcrR family transcriptional regulator [Parafrankia sp. EUN1f]|uniref:TetR/AcrR family transcriptional regulator n=1 Tax=Parafrankia sp. EUN1f TaxID=102897 RepID=UPI0001C45665|nr:TetR/AcrR family transcriptional regulator [Parafrankia sp. EUN1f]EFC82803.1 transcriptional regulator, TetR family [Parafrankia sp. EUN1f]
MPEHTQHGTTTPIAPRPARDDQEVGKRRGTGRTRRGRQTRSQLVDAARTVFERDGFLHARVADICDLAGFSHGSFYTYFVSKEEIFREVVDSVELDLLSPEPSTSTADPVERIRAANRHYLETYATSAKIMHVIQQVATFDEDVHKIRLQRHEVFARSIERRVASMQDAGIADRTVDPAYAAQALGGMVAYFADLLFNTDNSAGFTLDNAVEQLTILWANALGVRASD